jgi:hypothetical protein
MNDYVGPVDGLAQHRRASDIRTSPGAISQRDAALKILCIMENLRKCSFGRDYRAAYAHLPPRALPYE